MACVLLCMSCCENDGSLEPWPKMKSALEGSLEGSPPANLRTHPAALNLLTILPVCTLCAEIFVLRSNSTCSKMSKLLFIPPKKAQEKPSNSLPTSPVLTSRYFRQKLNKAIWSPRNFECGLNCALPLTLAGLVEAGVSTQVEICVVS